jgi:hypothetical protein
LKDKAGGLFCARYIDTISQMSFTDPKAGKDFSWKKISSEIAR